jgi:hypothetical protein
MSVNYPNLSDFIGMCFGQDFDLWGNSVPEIVSTYKDGSDANEWDAISNDINNFRLNYSNNLDSAFKKLYGNYIDPKSWDHTTDSFLSELQRLLKEKE